MVHVKEPDADFPISSATDEWLLYLQPKYLMPLEDFHLQDEEGFSFDFSRASLAGLEEVLLDGYEDYSDLVRDDDEVRKFVVGVIAYLGESLLRVAGGWWTADDPSADVPGSQLRLHFDPALGLEPLSPADLVVQAVSLRTGGEFGGYHAMLDRAVQQRVTEHPGWEPTKHLTPGVDRLDPPPSEFLDAWLAERKKAFPTWAADHAHAGTWDFSPESLDALEALLRREITFEGNDFATAEERALAEQAAWYIGEVFIRAKGGKWFYVPPEEGPDQVTAGQPHIRQLAPGADLARPLAAIEVTLDSTMGTPLRVQLDRYGRLKRL